ncbi:SHOCT domain-containing protein [Hoeflea sp. AS60]|uniref:SHOCT domain-containing protein n=1 Tax=Hoeflea sp. AS60 TaxID=3135780 RepID=UPI00316B6C1C
MSELTQDARKALAEIADRHGVSQDAVEHVLMALMAGQGTQAQFNHPDLGGMGQWSLGGMTMVGDMFNNALKARVDGLCSDVSQLMRQSEPLHRPSEMSSQSQSQGPQSQGAQSQGDSVSLFVSGGSSSNWWPGNLGHAASTGSQNQMRYAWFPDTARLAIDPGNGNVRVYDTADHRIGGFSQQQAGDQSLSFTSQHGLIKLSDLREVEIDGQAVSQSQSAGKANAPSLSDVLLKAAAQNLASDTLAAPAETPDFQSELKEAAKLSEAADEADIFAKIERLAALHAKGILTDAEYQTKKSELLARI